MRAATQRSNQCRAIRTVLAFASSSAANGTYITFTYIGAGTTTRTWTVTAPATPGTYEIRLFLNNGYTRVATSPPVIVQ